MLSNNRKVQQRGYFQNARHAPRQHEDRSLRAVAVLVQLRCRIASRAMATDPGFDREPASLSQNGAGAGEFPAARGDVADVIGGAGAPE